MNLAIQRPNKELVSLKKDIKLLEQLIKEVFNARHFDFKYRRAFVRVTIRERIAILRNLRNELKNLASLDKKEFSK